MNGPLLLDDDDLGQAVRELFDLRGDQRMDHREPQEADAAGAEFGLIEAESAQCLPHIEIRLPGRDDADAGGTAAEGLAAVEPVGQRVGARRVQPDTFTAPLHLGQGGLEHPGRQAMLPLLALEHHQGQLRIDTVGADLHGP